MKSLCLTIRLEALRKNNGYATNVKCCSTSLLVTNANQTSFVQSYLLITLNQSAKGWVNCCVLQRGLLIQLRVILLNCSLWTASAQYFWTYRYKTLCIPYIHMTDIISNSNEETLYPFVLKLRSFEILYKGQLILSKRYQTSCTPCYIHMVDISVRRTL